MDAVLAAVELYVSAGDRFTRIRVINDFIGIKDIIAVVNLSFTMQLVSTTYLLKLICNDVDGLGFVFQRRSRPSVWLRLLRLGMSLAGLL